MCHWKIKGCSLRKIQSLLLFLSYSNTNFSSNEPQILQPIYLTLIDYLHCVWENSRHQRQVHTCKITLIDKKHRKYADLYIQKYNFYGSWIVLGDDSILISAINYPSLLCEVIIISASVQGLKNVSTVSSYSNTKKDYNIYIQKAVKFL